MENGRERQVGGEMCRTIHKNDFKKDSPVPYFRLFFVLTSKYGQYFQKYYPTGVLVKRKVEKDDSRR